VRNPITWQPEPGEFPSGVWGLLARWKRRHPTPADPEVMAREVLAGRELRYRSGQTVELGFGPVSTKHFGISLQSAFLGKGPVPRVPQSPRVYRAAREVLERARS
jgi:hypothetical protein